MKRKLFVPLILIAFIVMAISSCGSMKSYVSARTILNDYWESYLDRRDMMPDGPEKDALRAKFNDTGDWSYFTEADMALDAWGEALGTEEEVATKRLYLTIFNRLINLLVREGIIITE